MFTSTKYANLRSKLFRVLVAIRVSLGHFIEKHKKCKWVCDMVENKRLSGAFYRVWW